MKSSLADKSVMAPVETFDENIPEGAKGTEPFAHFSTSESSNIEFEDVIKIDHSFIEHTLLYSLQTTRHWLPLDRKRSMVP